MKTQLKYSAAFFSFRSQRVNIIKRYTQLHATCIYPQGLFIPNSLRWTSGKSVRNWSETPKIRRLPFYKINNMHVHHWVLMFPLICVLTDGWANNRDAVDLRRHRAHYDVTVMSVRPMLTRFTNADMRHTLHWVKSLLKGINLVTMILW